MIILVRFAPFFLANALFRICAFALIIVFLDWWSVIPFALLLLLNLVRHCIITTIMLSSLSREDFFYFSTMVSHSLPRWCLVSLSAGSRPQVPHQDLTIRSLLLSSTGFQPWRYWGISGECLSHFTCLAIFLCSLCFSAVWRWPFFISFDLRWQNLDWPMVQVLTVCQVDILISILKNPAVRKNSMLSLMKLTKFRAVIWTFRHSACWGQKEGTCWMGKGYFLDLDMFFLPSRWFFPKIYCSC